ncbi:MAG: hypothetical protein AAB857_04510 [Patescibacteria group bacterium]
MVIPREARRITYSTEIRNLKKSLSLSDYQKSVVIGTLLGDGSLAANWSKTNFSLQVAHSVKQKTYILWKYGILKDWILSKPRYYSRNNSITIKTISHPEISQLAMLFYPHGRKVMPDNIKELIHDPIILAVWYMDDGNIIKRNGTVYGYHLNTQSFGKRENIILSQALNDVYGIESMLELNHGRYRLRIMKKKSRNKFQGIIRKYILPEMEYKLS